ncbi:MAG TPA: hypothetical protein VMU75_01010 [Acidimicrobiales bacterium]|nr:hypothetical protein [Acidimicrobiales bacterium]
MSVSTQPTEAARHRRRRFKVDRDVEEWHGSYVRYDIVKEFTLALIVVLLLTVVASILFSSPDDHPVTLKSWATANPVDFAQTAITELDGTSGTAGYGPPYNSTPGASQDIVGPISLESAFGVHHPINTMKDYVIDPLKTLPNAPAVHAALTSYTSASPSLQQKWTGAYEKGVAKASFSNGSLGLPAGDYGPVAPMIASLTSMARSGALDGALVSSSQFYGTDYTKPLLFIADGTYMANLGAALHLQGGQWGMMNETGSYPGQAWLWLYTMWYQVSPFTTSSNADAQIWGIMMILTLLLALVPFIPGVRSIPRKIGLYRLIWRQHYRSVEVGGAGGSTGPPAPAS